MAAMTMIGSNRKKNLKCNMSSIGLLGVQNLFLVLIFQSEVWNIAKILNGHHRND